MKRSFSYCGTVLWNKLLVELQTAATLHEFKKRLESSDLDTRRITRQTCKTVVNLSFYFSFSSS